MCEFLRKMLDGYPFLRNKVRFSNHYLSSLTRDLDLRLFDKMLIGSVKKQLNKNKLQVFCNCIFFVKIFDDFLMIPNDFGRLLMVPDNLYRFLMNLDDL